MSRIDEDDVGYIKYTGAGVAEGIIDAGSAGSALIGLDESLRFFNSRQSPDLATLEYEIPVRTQAGSWEAVVLAATAGAGAFAFGYLKKAGEKLAENDLNDLGLKDVFKKSMLAIQTLARLVKHTRKSRGWEQARFVMNADAPLVEVLNDQGEPFILPAEFFRWFQALPPRLLIRMTAVIRNDRSLAIGVVDRGSVSEVIIVDDEKALFDDAQEEEPEDVLFPELEHGKQVRLEGRLIRGNQASNSVGLEYLGHVLNCVPEQGSIRRFKPALFLRCIVDGLVTRHAKNRFVADRRPTVIIKNVQPLEHDTGQGGLFAG